MSRRVLLYGSDESRQIPMGHGTTVNDMEKYYDALNFKDWTHAVSKAPMLKAQHPGYETWRDGIHGKKQSGLRGLSHA